MDMAIILIPHRFTGPPPTGYCGVCEVPFYGDRDMRRHLRSGAHADQVEVARAAEERRKLRLAAFTTTDDPEIQAHLKTVGKRMLAEGRMVVKPHEKAGM